MLWWLLGCAGQERYASAFDWGYDRTRVVAVRVWPLAGPGGFPRLVDALILGPEPVEEVRVEVCGLSEELPAAILGSAAVDCFGTPELVEIVARELPAWWTPGPLGFDCPAPDSGWPDCQSVPSLRVAAASAEGEGSAVISPILIPDAPPEPPPGEAEVRLEQVEGQLRAGGKVRMRFSTASDWPAPDWGTPYRWYAEAGTWLGTGRTLDAGSDGARRRAENWLLLPRDHHGPLRVSVVLDGPTPVWAEQILEVP